jgi:membrane protease YdiL (CAAX protease family)
VGPIFLSALSLFISYTILQFFAYKLDPAFNLLASRGIPKVAFICMAIYQILLFISIQPKKFLKEFFDRVLFFFVKERWFFSFSYLFISFFLLHSIVLFIFYQQGHILYDPNGASITTPIILKTLFGLFVVFMLAWTEELIFRGTIYPYFAQYYSPLVSMLTTSLIFMLAHSLKNPLILLTTEWKLGLGLFLLGLLLNQVFVITKKLYTGMGIHAGLVFVKVIIRRMPFLKSVPDLRQSHLVHILFLCAIIFLFVWYKRSLTSFNKIQSHHN